MGDINKQKASGNSNIQNQNINKPTFIINKNGIYSIISRFIQVSVRIPVRFFLILTSLLFVYVSRKYLACAFKYNPFSLNALLFCFAFLLFSGVILFGIVELCSKNKYKIAVFWFIAIAFFAFGYYFAPNSVRYQLDVGLSSNNLLIKSKVEMDEGVLKIYPKGKEYVEIKPETFPESLLCYLNPSLIEKEQLPLLYEEINKFDLTQFALNVVSKYQSKPFIIYIDAKKEPELLSDEEKVFSTADEDSNSRKQRAIIFPACSTEIAAYGEMIDDGFKPHFFIEFSNDHKSEIITPHIIKSRIAPHVTTPNANICFDFTNSNYLYTKQYYIYRYAENRFSYDDWKHEPTKYNKKPVVITGTIEEIVENELDRYWVVSAGQDERYYVADCRINKEINLFLGDKISVYGICAANNDTLSNESAQSFLGVCAYYVDYIPAEEPQELLYERIIKQIKIIFS